MLRRGRRRRVVHAGGAAHRDHPAVAVAAHQVARARARRRRARPAAPRRVADAGRAEPPSRGADSRARARAGPAGRAVGARARARRARDRDGALDGGRRPATPHRRLARAASERRDPAARVPPPRTCSRTRSSRGSPTSRSARGPFGRWDGPLETVDWEEFVVVVASSDALAERRNVSLEELRDREWVLYHPDHGLAGVVEADLPRRRLPPARNRAHLAGRGCGAARSRGPRDRARARQHRPARGRLRRPAASRRA